MNGYETRPLTDQFGIEIKDLQLKDVVANGLFPDLRAAFEEHSALLLRDQDLDNPTHIALAQLFGEIEDRKADERKPGEAFEVPEVSNIRPDGSLTDQMDLHTLNLQSNMLWHSDSTFLPRPALTNILIARVLPSRGGNTELASTRAAWREMPAALKSRIEGRGIWHRYAQSRARISEELAKLPMFHKWPDQHWKSVWHNPVNGEEALYVASHSFAVDGYDKEDGAALIDDLIEFCTQERYVYSHKWRVGDVLIWDQRAVLHRGTPWPYDEPRKLTSICVSASDEDGVADMRLSN
ncbi:TauD/TfdA dioxygenase family protein [Shimia biformata]|uniref:TauD/TfdA dioxygenase family protein n=1 Tax=Shimia biformata TaxID=1294299 RepID=UPI00194F76CA|nr:TauD/TfdA family dioxygenase [Shimia biformata]